MLIEEANEGTDSWLVNASAEAAVDGAVASLSCVEEEAPFPSWPTANGVGCDPSIKVISY